ncbi:hypothetical protein PFISCL1PPCAC_12092, partial [Pristionchus fissidentatus]
MVAELFFLVPSRSSGRFASPPSDAAPWRRTGGVFDGGPTRGVDEEWREEERQSDHRQRRPHFPVCCCCCCTGAPLGRRTAGFAEVPDAVSLGPSLTEAGAPAEGAARVVASCAAPGGEERSLRGLRAACERPKRACVRGRLPWCTARRPRLAAPAAWSSARWGRL